MRLFARIESQIAVTLLLASSLALLVARDVPQVRSLEPSLRISSLWISSDPEGRHPMIPAENMQAYYQVAVYKYSDESADIGVFWLIDNQQVGWLGDRVPTGGPLGPVRYYLLGPPLTPGRHECTFKIMQSLGMMSEILASNSMYFVVSQETSATTMVVTPSRTTQWAKSSSIVTQPLMADGSLIVLILVGGIAIGLVIGIGLGAFYFGLKFWYRTYHRIPAEAMNARIVASASLPLADHQNSQPQLMSEKMEPIKSCVKCGKALPLDAHYCSECREEQNYYYYS